MGKAAPKRHARQAVAASPINFRMPQPLRLRLRRFAESRHLGEAEALRAIVSERLDEIESERDLAAAERWQFRQAYATWDRFRSGEGRTVPREEIDRIFIAALAEQGPATDSR